MNTKYLVIADTYPYSYGVEFTLFRIFDTEKEAIDFIVNNPKVKLDENIDFDFFEYYDDKYTKEEYIKRNYIKKFNGNPTYIGGYRE